MKNIFRILLCFTVLFTSCEEKGTDTQFYFDLKPTDEIINFNNNQDEKKVLVFTNIENWTVSVDKDWCAVTTISNPSPAVPALLISVIENNYVDARAASITITAPGLEDIVLDVRQLGNAPTLFSENSSGLIDLKINKGSYKLTVTSNIEYDIELSPDVNWLEINEIEDTEQSTEIVDRSFNIIYSKNDLNSDRNTRILISPKNASLDVEPLVIPVAQIGLDMSNIYQEGDIKVKVTSATVIRGGEYLEETVDKTIDGNNLTTYRSADSPTSLSDYVIIEYTLEYDKNEHTQFVDYIRLIQNSASPNSVFSKGSILVEDIENDEWTVVKEFEVGEGNNVLIKPRIMNHNKIRLHLYYNSLDGFVSLAEFECFKRKDIDNKIEQAKAFFQDDMFSILKPGITIDEIDKIENTIIYNIAKDIYNGTYTKEFRAATYSPVLGSAGLTMGARSTLDNPTGIFFEPGVDHLIYVSGLGDGKKIDIQIQDYKYGSNDKGYGGISINRYLEDGLNVIMTKQWNNNDNTYSRDPYSGTGYIKYYGKENPGINIHFLFGKEIGYWNVRKGHTDQDWKRILNLAVKTQEEVKTEIPLGLMIDVLGEKVQLINTVDAFKKFSPDGVSEIMKLHDQVLDIQYEMLGLKKNNAIPTRPILGVRSWDGSPNWDGTSANYPNYERDMLVPDAFIDNIWLYTHEYGHGNQIAGMDGGGWTEITNQIFGPYVQWQMGDRNNLLLEHYNWYSRPGYPDDPLKTLYGERFNGYFCDAFINNKLYFEQGGLVGKEINDYVSIVPLWQLTLYFMIAGEGNTWYKPDFWADIHWAAIQEYDKNDTHGERNVNLMKNAIDASNLDLTQFFVDMGLLRVSDRLIYDNGENRVNITEVMVNEVELYGAQKAKPETSAMKYISANSMEAFKYKRAVTGVLNQGVTLSNNAIRVSHATWQNVVAYETYNEGTLLDVCMAGTGVKDNSSTYIRFPEGATEVKAISWDGTRTTVYKVN